MKQVIITFSTYVDLRYFLISTHLKEVKYTPTNLTILCTCSVEDIQLAIEAFNAKVVEVKTPEAGGVDLLREYWKPCLC